MTSGPPIRLFSRAERVRRRRVVTALILGVSAFAIVLTLVALGIATRPNAQVNLGSNTFKVGNAYTLNKRIRSDRYPLLFQDLRNNSIDIFVDHQHGKPYLEGWRAIEAHAPNAPRRCQLSWSGEDYVDPCNGMAYPATGVGLRRFEVRVVDGVVYVNFRTRL